MKKLLAITIAFINVMYVQAQENLNIDSLTKKKELVLFVERTYTNLINYNVIDDQTKSLHNTPGINIGGSYIFYFQDRWGVSVGLSFSSFQQSLHQKDLFISINQVDRDSNVFELWTNANIKETNKIYFAEIPIMLNLLVGRSKKIHGIINGGLVPGAMAWGQYTKQEPLKQLGNIQPVIHIGPTPHKIILIMNMERQLMIKKQLPEADINNIFFRCVYLPVLPSN